MKDVLRIAAFTEKGGELIGKIIGALKEYQCLVFEKGDSLSDFCHDAFEEKTPLIFVGAVGIAVRSIAPHLKDKLSDPPVIVMDELGRYIIPILSGHYGGANQLAADLAAELKNSHGAVPVITTATDINGVFSVDSFARERDLEVFNKDGIKEVSTKALEGKAITLSIKAFPPEEKVDVVISDNPSDYEYGTLGLKPGDESEIRIVDKGIVLGLGCKKGKSLEEIKSFAEECLKKQGLVFGDLSAIATIDIKEEEPGIKALVEELKIPLITFDAETLKRVPGKFSASFFVRDRVGVDNVCERAAVAATGGKGIIIQSKAAKDGITISLADVL